MKSIRFRGYGHVVMVALAVGVGGLAGQRGDAMAQASAPSAKPCNTVATALIGALAGGVLGKLTHHHNVVRGAAIGGAVGALACVAINYQSRRTQTAQQVRAENPQIAPSPQIVVTSYHLQVQPADIQAGQPVSVNTNIGVLAGSQESVQSMSVRYDLIDSTGTVQKSETKPLDNVAPDGGSYESTLGFTPPAGVPRGEYAVRAYLLVNGRTLQQQQGSYTII